MLKYHLHVNWYQVVKYNIETGWKNIYLCIKIKVLCLMYISYCPCFCLSTVSIQFQYILILIILTLYVLSWFHVCQKKEKTRCFNYRRRHLYEFVEESIRLLPIRCSSCDNHFTNSIMNTNCLKFHFESMYNRISYRHNVIAKIPSLLLRALCVTFVRCTTCRTIFVSYVYIMYV